MMTLPFVCFCDFCFCKEDFNANHTIKEHFLRLKGLSEELEDVYLDDLYEEKRFQGEVYLGGGDGLEAETVVSIV